MTKDNGCVGSYSVSGYTRSDGTQVSGYIRTCGAAHNSTDNTSNTVNSNTTPMFELKVEHNEEKKPNSWKEKIKKIVEQHRLKEEKMQRRADILYPNMPDSKRKEIIEILEAGAKELSEIEKERWSEHAKNWGGAALELGSAFVPGLGGAKAVATGTKLLKSTLGKKIAEEVATGALKGTSSGAVFGLGEGMINDENLLLSTIEGGLEGAVFGTGLGFIGSKGNQIYDKTTLKAFKPISEMTKEERKKFRKVAQKYYQDYVQGKSVEHPELGKIKFTLKGIEETINKNLDSIRSVPRLEKNIKNAKLKEANELYKKRKDHYSIFYTLEGEDEIYQIAKDENGLRYYLTKKK